MITILSIIENDEIIGNATPDPTDSDDSSQISPVANAIASTSRAVTNTMNKFNIGNQPQQIPNLPAGIRG